MIDKILEKYNLKYEDLGSDEKETIHSWMSRLQEGQMSLEKVKDYIDSMKMSVETELSGTSHNSKQDIFLKARLRNYILLEALLSSPEKAQAQLDRMVASFTSNIKDI